jgi:hypothetical protein
VPFNESVYDDEAVAGLNETREVAFVRACDNCRVMPPIEAQWQFENLQVDYDPDRPALKVSGRVTNVGPDAVDGFAPMVLCFTGEGQYALYIQYTDAPNFIAPGETVEFEEDHGYDSIYLDEPFAGGDTFVVGMAEPVSGGTCPYS